MFNGMFTDEELQSAKTHYERAAGVQHHFSRSGEIKCHCGRPAAQDPGLITSIFHRDQAQTQRQAARAHKCVECYQIDCYIQACAPKRSA